MFWWESSTSSDSECTQQLTRVSFTRYNKSTTICAEEINNLAGNTIFTTQLTFELVTQRRGSYFTATTRKLCPKRLEMHRIVLVGTQFVLELLKLEISPGNADVYLFQWNEPTMSWRRQPRTLESQRCTWTDRQPSREVCSSKKSREFSRNSTIKTAKVFAS